MYELLVCWLSWLVHGVGVLNAFSLLVQLDAGNYVLALFNVVCLLWLARK